MRKNDELKLEIIDNGMNLEGIARWDNKVIFIPGALKGETVHTKIIKVNSSFCIGKIEKIEKGSNARSEPFCEVYGRCGGCAGQHIQYEEQLKIKEELVRNALSKQKVEVESVSDIIGMGIPYNYRNKAQYPVRKTIEGENKIGFYAKRSHQIIEHEKCYIQNQEIDELSKEIFKILLFNGFDGYNEETYQGDIRHVLIRRGYHTDEIMVVIIINKESIFDDVRMENVIKVLQKKNDNIKSIVLNLNTSKTNEILGNKEKLIYGSKYISDYIGDVKYNIGPKTFFQVNTVQAETLYNTLKEVLNLSKEDILFDLYSGVGAIGLFLSKEVKEVYGIEIEEQAVEMANLNIQENNITNAEYIAGSVDQKIQEFKQRKIKPDVIVVDPPRKGLDLESIENIIAFGAKKIGYVSCSPATLARDLRLLSPYYTIKSVIPIDLFPHTEHVETVCVLELK